VTKWRIDFARFRDPGWLHWMKTVSLLAAYLAGSRHAIWAAIALCTVMSAWYFVRLGALRPFPVQIRLGYLALLLLGLIPQLFWIHWVQLIGTLAMVTIGYCLMERVLSLLPWNRTDPPAQMGILSTLLRGPSGGLIVAAEAVCSAPPCSMMSR
jgi:hypothetical protein